MSELTEQQRAEIRELAAALPTLDDETVDYLATLLARVEPPT